MTGTAPAPGTAVLQALTQPVIVIDETRSIVFVNAAAEAFFGASLSVLRRQRLDDLIAFGSPIVALAEAVAERRAPMAEYRVRVDSTRFGDTAAARIVDVFASPISDVDARVALLFQERGMADKLDRQLVSRGAARSAPASPPCWRMRSRTRSRASAARRSFWSSRWRPMRCRWRNWCARRSTAS